ncbi:MAG: DUF3857 domain-containing protein [Bacteroidota bacterium]
MKKIILSLSSILLSFFSVFSQDLELSVLSIPDSLKENANAIIRLEDTKIDISSSSKMTIHKTMIVTVFNKKGDSDGYITMYYDDHSKIKNYSALIYNSLGVEIKKVKNKEFKDISAANGFSLYEDNRVLYYRHVPQSYPYTIKYEYEINTPNTAFIPKWIPINGFNESTQKSKYTLTYPDDIAINFREYNFDDYCIENNSSENTLSYTLKNAKAIKYENRSPFYLDFEPYVQFAANKFHLAGVDGKAENWTEFGNWMYQNLLKGRDELPEATKVEIKNLINGIDDPIERARLVYDYMQKKTRYISIQIGIGGWKPMLADDVDRLGYGDCKALTNYTQSLLKAADVHSYYTIIYADTKRNINNDLASIQGNHAILMVPSQKDTVWLECTNQKVPFGYLGNFTDDRDVLVVTPEGGKILHTKSYSDTENKQLITGEYSIDINGNISAKAKIESYGVQYDDNYSIADMDPKDKETYYKEFFKNINNLNIEGITVKSDDKTAVFTEDISFNAGNYGVFSGDRMLVRINAFNVNDNVPKRIRNRKLPLEIKYGYLDKDEVIINLPEKFQIEAMANEKTVETKFGTYKISIEKISEQQLKYSRKLLIKHGNYTANDYDDYRKFRKKINQLDNSKIVLVRNKNS